MPSEITLSMVATPIGNLRDLSSRARDVLAAAEVVFCEDTRVTKSLFELLGLKAQPHEWVRADDSQAEATLQGACERLFARGDTSKWVFVTDAGSPGMSDPGARIVRWARQNGLRVEAIPGPSAVTSFLSVLGGAGTAFRFHGFFPRKQGERDHVIETLQKDALASFEVFFESPHRIEDTLRYLDERRDEMEYLALAKELTKIHEWSLEGDVRQVTSEALADPERLRGEWVFGFRLRRSESSMARESSNGEWLRAARCLHAAAVSTADAVQALVQEFGVSRNSAYEEVLRLKQKK